VNAVAELGAILKQRTWDKEVILWSGSDADLQEATNGAKTVEVDLLDVFDENRLPADDDEARRELATGLRTRLQALDCGPGRRLVLIVRSCGLLARYGLGLKPFYDWFCGDYGLVLIPLAGGEAALAWPEGVTLERDRLSGYFTGPGMCSRAIGARTGA